jgi:hypothetical protein
LITENNLKRTESLKPSQIIYYYIFVFWDIVIKMKECEHSLPINIIKWKYYAWKWLNHHLMKDLIVKKYSKIYICGLPIKMNLNLRMKWVFISKSEENNEINFVHLILEFKFIEMKNKLEKSCWFKLKRRRRVAYYHNIESLKTQTNNLKIRIILI